MIIKLSEKTDLAELRDTVEDCATKLSFLGEFFDHRTDMSFEISDKGSSGIFLILRDIGAELDLVVNEMDHKIESYSKAGKKRAVSDLNNLTKE